MEGFTHRDFFAHENTRHHQPHFNSPQNLRERKAQLKKQHGRAPNFWVLDHIDGSEHQFFMHELYVNAKPSAR